MTEAKTTKSSRIPTFANVEEEREFWDTHDLTDFWDEFEPIEWNMEGPYSEAVTLHIDLETMDEVKAIADEQRLRSDALLHVWILERRDAERQRRAGGASDPPGGPLSPETSANGADPGASPRETAA